MEFEEWISKQLSSPSLRTPAEPMAPARRRRIGPRAAQGAAALLALGLVGFGLGTGGTLRPIQLQVESGAQTGLPVSTWAGSPPPPGAGPLEARPAAATNPGGPGPPLAHPAAGNPLNGALRAASPGAGALESAPGVAQPPEAPADDHSGRPPGDGPSPSGSGGTPAPATVAPSPSDGHDGLPGDSGSGKSPGGSPSPSPHD
ncbi:MAG TPA: hypothetical protein VGR61_04630 [Candidatus Dormibacteraeota bacterium]|nr:hypothetical protein [Candidatus Dormibacteraeota bacterium]